MTLTIRVHRSDTEHLVLAWPETLAETLRAAQWWRARLPSSQNEISVRLRLGHRR